MINCLGELFMRANQSNGEILNDEGTLLAKGGLSEREGKLYFNGKEIPRAVITGVFPGFNESTTLVFVENGYLPN
jgi:hypothetical protein